MFLPRCVLLPRLVLLQLGPERSFAWLACLQCTAYGLQAVSRNSTWVRVVFNCRTIQYELSYSA
ncbi:hypothetical protein AWB69_06027 [Caballeronia udeis]|uniref:Uncharacterized protein n=1 Tax=Caballeronia udeis TaxID=1232866 RepID=A0A158IIW2_9BURK|nr:hypothetical protein AWB69_06027 [Caballeronia udeis]